MSTDLNHLRLAQLERALAPYAQLQGLGVPRQGWLRAVRESLGRTLRVQAARVGVTAPSLHKSEAAEADGRISLAQLRRLAAALDCELVYGLVPRQPLSQVVEGRAAQLARDEGLGVSHSMALEDQRPADPFIEGQVSRRQSELLAGPWSRLWR